MNKKLIDLHGQRFGCLTVLSRDTVEIGRSATKNGQYRWVCRCDCGSMALIRSGELRYGKALSCGCYNVEKNLKHGHATRANGKSREYSTWQTIIEKCHNQNCNAYKFYGARGIEVCQRWRDSFDNFYQDMGPKPKGLTIERIDNDGNYAPGNCIWDDYSAQNGNKRHGSPRNKKNGLPLGVCIRKNGTYTAAVTFKKFKYYLGVFNTIEAAKAAVDRAFDEHAPNLKPFR